MRDRSGTPLFGPAGPDESPSDDGQAGEGVEATADARRGTSRGAVALLSLSLFCLVLLLLVGASHLARVALEPPLGFHGARLGLTARDVRDHFDRSGSWRAGPDELVWTAKDASDGVREAHFEFHMGSLVAVRARVSPADAAAQGDPLQATTVSVLARSVRGDGDVDVFLAARDCPTHAAEVARILGAK